MIGISCRQLALQLSISRTAPLGKFQRLIMYLHLGLCPNCRTYRSQLQWLDRALETAGHEDTVKLNDAARLRIKQALDQVVRREE